MVLKASILAIYFLIVLGLGLLARSRIKDSPSQYFLAGRGLSPFVLIVTMAATNFSAFTVFGASGAGYRDGLAFFPIMAFGTGFMALTFWIIGRKVWEIGKKHGLVTPAELIGHIYKNPFLTGLFALVMIVFTVPYLAIQPIAGGKVLNQLFELPEVWGAVLITAIILIYTLRGGLKAVAWTDVFQGFLMVILMVSALFIVASHYGGISKGLHDVLETNPELFSRPGGTGKYVPGMWFGFILLWFFCDPMFPQLFQRFYAAKNKSSLARTAILYPAICTVVFIIPVTLGVLGHIDYPDLEGRTSDNIMNLLMTSIAGPFMGTLVLAAGLAALMSTMDSQLLTLSSIFTRDILPFITKAKDVGIKKESRNSLAGRWFVAVLAIAGLAIALNPVGNIVDMAVSQAFTGLAVLFPSVLFGLYLKNPRAIPAICSILLGELWVVLYAIPGLNMPSFGFLPAVPVIGATVLVYFIVHIATGPIGMPKIEPGKIWYCLGFLLIFILAMDFWRWNEIGSLWFGLPSWAWYFVFLSAAQTVLMYFWMKPALKDTGDLQA
jgi:SSS family solute:Na+ symporter